MVIRSNTVFFIEIPEVSANNIDPDHLLHSVGSDLDLQCLPITLLGNPTKMGN